MDKYIKIYGERNTNTNYISRLIELNLDVVELNGAAPEELFKVVPGYEFVRDAYFTLTFRRNLGWKHMCVRPLEALQRYPIVNEHLVFLTITKNPYSWLLSLHRNPYHQTYDRPPSFEEFLQLPWTTNGRENIRGNISSPIELWNRKNRSYLQLAGEHTLNTTTERIFADAQGIVEELSSRFMLRSKVDAFVNYERSTKDKSKDGQYYRDYYMNERWRTNLSPEAISIINRSVDQDLMNHFGYSLLEA